MCNTPQRDRGTPQCVTPGNLYTPQRTQQQHDCGPMAGSCATAATQWAAVHDGQQRIGFYDVVGLNLLGSNVVRLDMLGLNVVGLDILL